MNKSPTNLLLKKPLPGTSTHGSGGSGRKARFRRVAGVVGGVLAIVFMAWLPLGILGVVPFALVIPGESALRTHAGIAVACLLATAWACWED